MNTNNNDIDALLEHLRSGAYRQQIPFGNPDPSRWAVALTALIAERDALKRRLEVGERQLRLANIDQFKQPPADRDRELRERLVCAIWPDMLRIYNRSDPNGNNWDLVRINARAQALQDANAMIAAMRKEKADGQ